MIKDITIGQYFPGKSVIHRLDPRVKILLSLAYIILLFVASSMTGLAVGAGFILVCYLISRIPLKMILKSLKPIVPIVIFTAVLNMLFVDGKVLWEWAFIRITEEGLLMAALLASRIICLIAGTTLLT
ncbi:MAG: energy-coupling factor transporter transmembrane component T, partial [Angelakisella sp.]